MGDRVSLKQPAGRLIVLQHQSALIVNHQYARVYGVKYLLIVSLTLYLLVAGALQHLLDMIQRLHNLPLVLIRRFGMKQETIVPVADGLEEKRHLMHMLAVAEPEVEVELTSL